MKTVDDFNIGIAEIFGVSVDKEVVSAGGAIVFNTETGQNIYLHAVVGNKQMAAPAANRPCGVIEEVVDIKNIKVVR